MRILHVVALSAGLAGAALFTNPGQAATVTNQTAALNELGADAQSFYSAEQVGVSRRASRAKCTTLEDAGTCDCLASGYAQTLTPPEVDLAAAMLSTKARIKARAMNAFSTPEARDAARAHVEAAAAQYEPLCRGPAPS